LDGDDVAAPGVDAAEGGVERGRFAAAGRTRDDDHSGVLAEHAADLARKIAFHAEVFEARGDTGLVEQPQGELLTHRNRGHRDADVDSPIGQSDGEAAFLNDVFLGEIDLAEDLDDVEEGQPHRSRDLAQLMQYAVDADAKAEGGLLRFEVDVRHAGPQGGEQDLLKRGDRLGRAGGVGRVDVEWLRLAVE